MVSVLIVFTILGLWAMMRGDLNPNHQIGDRIDSLNNVIVYYNGPISNVSGRNLSENGYNLGLKYQCVEFVKRYYYEQLDHKMPNSYGHAKDFFNPGVKDGQVNADRALTQFSNPSGTKPRSDDLLIFSGTFANKFGHVAIISEVRENEIEIIQQNTGSYGESRETFQLENKDGKWSIENNRILGWLRKK